MHTDRQREAARRNGVKSHGPVTKQGKARSSQNAVTHGIMAQGVLLQNESPEIHRAFVQRFCDLVQPVGPIEEHLLEQMISAAWRERRLWTTEAALWDLQMSRQQKQVDGEFVNADNYARQAIAFQSLSDNSFPSWQTLDCYERRLNRIFNRALDQLRNLQRERLGHHFNSAALDALSKECRETPNNTPDPPPKPPQRTNEPPPKPSVTPGLILPFILFLLLAVSALLFPVSAVAAPVIAAEPALHSPASSAVNSGDRQ